MHLHLPGANAEAGRRRGAAPQKTEAITAAFFAELGAHGYAGLTMDRVAERARVGKAALFRRSPSRREMLVDLVGNLHYAGRHAELTPERSRRPARHRGRGDWCWSTR